MENRGLERSKNVRFDSFEEKIEILHHKIENPWAYLVEKKWEENADTWDEKLERK